MTETRKSLLLMLKTGKPSEITARVRIFWQWCKPSALELILQLWMPWRLLSVPAQSPRKIVTWLPVNNADSTLLISLEEKTRASTEGSSEPSPLLTLQTFLSSPTTEPYPDRSTGSWSAEKLTSTPRLSRLSRMTLLIRIDNSGRLSSSSKPTASTMICSTLLRKLRTTKPPSSRLSATSPRGSY